MNPLLRIAGLGVRFPVRRRWFGRAETLRAVEGISFELAPGEALGVVGESGAGKSTLARAILRLVRPGAGEVVFLGRALGELPAREMKALRGDLQIVFQDPLASLDPRMTVGEIVAEPLRVHRRELERAARRARVAQMLERVGLSADMVSRYPHELSGGQCQRVGIARAMILGPKLLVCDEPLSALDVSIQAQIVSLLAELKRTSQLSMVFVSHNLAVVRRLCERVLVLYLGRMMELAPAAELYAHPRHPYTRALLEAVPVPDPHVQRRRLATALSGEMPSPLRPPEGCVFRTRCPHAYERCAREVPQWEAAAPGVHVACHRWRELEAGKLPP